MSEGTVTTIIDRRILTIDLPIADVGSKMSFSSGGPVRLTAPHGWLLFVFFVPDAQVSAVLEPGQHTFVAIRFNDDGTVKSAWKHLEFKPQPSGDFQIQGVAERVSLGGD